MAIRASEEYTLRKGFSSDLSLQLVSHGIHNEATDQLYHSILPHSLLHFCIEAGVNVDTLDRLVKQLRLAPPGLREELHASASVLSRGVEQPTCPRTAPQPSVGFKCQVSKGCITDVVLLTYFEMMGSVVDIDLGR